MTVQAVPGWRAGKHLITLFIDLEISIASFAKDMSNHPKIASNRAKE